VRIELTLEKLTLVRLGLEKKTNPRLCVHHKKSKYRTMASLKIQGIVERGEHLPRNKNALFVVAVDGNLKHDSST